MPDSPPAMTSHRPYLLRALYEWISDNGMTPHILVDAGQPGVRGPAHTVKDGRVVLNIAERAVAKLELDNEAVRFTARFGGVSHPVLVPVSAGLAIYARRARQADALTFYAQADRVLQRRMQSAEPIDQMWQVFGNRRQSLRQ